MPANISNNALSSTASSQTVNLGFGRRWLEIINDGANSVFIRVNEGTVSDSGSTVGFEIRTNESFRFDTNGVTQQIDRFSHISPSTTTIRYTAF